MSYFSKKEAFSYGWGKMKENFWFFVIALIVVFVAAGIFSSLQVYFSKTLVGLGILFTLIRIFVQIAISVGLVTITLKVFNNQKPVLNDFVANINLTWNYFLGGLVYMLIVLGGLILLIVPGIMWAMSYQMFGYFIIDKKMKPMEALRESRKITKGSRWNLFFFCILAGLINILGAIVFGIGLFATVPMTSMASVWVYKKLLNKKSEETTQSTPTM